MSSKAQGLSLSTIIIAALVLIVLVILVMTTTGFFGNRFNPGFERISDTSCNGRVVDTNAACEASERENYAADVPSGKKCCAKRSCEDLGGHCCSTGLNTISGGAWSCKGDDNICCRN